ncbi:MAG: kdpA [Chthoniobacteraceae bacterium]|nr:kdpA [Chthoniobacteraceae bacterium]
MKPHDWVQIFLYLGILLAITPLLGMFMHRVFSGRRNILSAVIGPLERLIYKMAGVAPEREMRWTEYAGALFAFNILGIAVLLALQLTQQWLPLNPQNFPNVPFALALNTAVSFVTNTNWQAYSGESTLGYLVQMAGLTVQNFVSAATGIAVLIALARGLTRKSAETIGNFWADLVRATLYLLAPLSMVMAIVLIWQGVPQTFSAYVAAKPPDGIEQLIPLGPVASQIAIKQLGTNGGGYFGQNSAHPFENPTPFSNFIEMLAIFAIPAGLTYTYGLMTKDRRQGWTIFGAMLALFLAGFAISWWAELQPNAVTGLASNMEGKEVRFGVMNSVLFSTITTDASCGAVNAMHDSLTPLAGGVALLNLLLGEVIFGGVGAGMYGMLVFVVLTVFLAGLMVGRSPEYLGKKIEAHEVRWSVVAALAPCVCILIGLAVACSIPAGSATLGNQGPHGFSEMFYAFASAAANNGSALAGVGVNNNFYNYTLAICMFLGRFAIIGPVLAIAGSMAGKKVAPPSPGTFPTTGFTFAGLLVAVILIVGALTFFPALTLGPIVEHLVMGAGRSF